MLCCILDFGMHTDSVSGHIINFFEPFEFFGFANKNLKIYLL